MNTQSFITKNKGKLIVAGIITAFLLFLIILGVSRYTHAINLEEQINSASASINVQEKRRIDLIYNLVDTVEAFAKHEYDTLTKVTEARTSVENGNVEDAKLSISAVAEAYPQLTSNENYKQLMTELAMTENLIAEQRNNFNEQMRSYRKFVRNPINKFILGITGYEPIENTDYTDYDAPVDAPQDLFGR